jgi:glutamate-1-semialdehyde 2,1-aminomutase
MGQDPAAAAAVTVLPWNDIAALRATLDGDIAAVIMEPINVNAGGFVADPSYLQQVRDLTRAQGAVLVFDEVITGYRVALGGAQARLGVTPDLTILGKALGGGFPISAVCGSHGVMAEAAEGRVAHVGTFNLNPLAAAAALATVTALEECASEIYPRLERLGDALQHALMAPAAAAGLPLQVNRVGAAAYAFVSPRPVTSYEDALQADIEGYRRLARALL